MVPGTGSLVGVLLIFDDEFDDGAGGSSLSLLLLLLLPLPLLLLLPPLAVLVSSIGRRDEADEAELEEEEE